MKLHVFAVFAAVAFSLACGAANLENEAMRSRKGALVLQTGSDWCVSGEAVRKVFSGQEFQRSKAIAQYACGVWDEMDSPTDAAKKANEDVKSLHIATKRFPAITCFTPGPQMRFFAQIENVPGNVNAEKLARAVAKVTKRKDEAEALFKKAASLSGEAAADCYGQAFDILAAMAGQFHFKELTEGSCGWKKEWEALKKLDEGDRYGWIMHFKMDEYETVRMVEKVTSAKKGEGGVNAESYVASIKAIPDSHFTPNQKQCVKILEYALSSAGTDKPLKENEKTLMKEVLAIDRDTLWGQFALGRLVMAGEKIETKGLAAAKVLPRPGSNSGSRPSFPLDQMKTPLLSIKPGAKLTEQQKFQIARYAALRLIGPAGWLELVNRPGSGPFVKAFLSDRTWMEDFAWSGTFPANSSDGWCAAGTGAGDGAKAILALESLVFQDKGRWVPFADGKFADNEGRRFMTALAIVYPDKSEAWLADVLDAYRTTALAGRLHKSAYSQGVYEWRFAVHAGHGSASVDNLAAQHRHLDKFVNLPQKAYGGTCWMIAYRTFNCFGDSVQGPYYYKPWQVAGEWPKRRYSQIVGGVCGELSKFGSATSNAHGLPSTTVGQPGHCAYSRRLTNGKWEIDYSVTGHSQMHMCFWNKHAWQYSPVLESTYAGDRETRLAAERMLALATLAEESKKDAKTVELFYRHACAAKPDHYGAWHAYGSHLMNAKMPLDKLRVWVRGCARGMKTGREPLWDILTPYFERVAKEKGAASLVTDLVEFAPLLRQGGTRIQEESDFGVVLKKWGDLLGGDDALRAQVLKAMLDAQYGTPDYFSQTLGWGASCFMKTPAGTAKFNECLAEVLSSKVKKGEKVSMNFAPLILAASRSGNLDAFRQMADLQAKLSPAAPKGESFPKSDFGGELLGLTGMLRTSSTSQYDHPERYALCIDDSPAGEGAFHTDKEDAPWAEVVLKGPSTIYGVVVVNKFGGVNASRQVPVELLVSDDGENWESVASDAQERGTYRFDLRGQSPGAKHVRVARKAGAKKEFFHLNKILVYGKKLY